MSDIRIPISLNPPLKGYLNYAHPFSILFGDGDECLPWVFSNFIQMISLKDCSSYQFHINSWWFDDEQLFAHYYVVVMKSVLDDNFPAVKQLMLYMMGQGFCPVGIFNEYYVPHRYSYQRLNFDHDYLIYGYDEGKDSFHIIGYTDKRHYEPTEITVPQYLEALRHTKFEDFHIHFFRKNRDKTYKFDCDKVKRWLKDYLESKDSFGYYDDRYYLGIDACRNLKNYLDIIKKDSGRIELRYFYALKEHKECMRMRIKYMEEHHCLKPDEALESRCEELISLAGFIESLCIRWNLLHDPEIIEKVKRKIDALIEKEIPFLEDLLCRIEKGETAKI